MCRRHADGKRSISIEEVATATGFDSEQVERAGRNLELGGYVTTHGGFGGLLDFTGVTGRALRTVGLRPTPESLADRMIESLRAIEANTDDEDERTRTRKALEAFSGAGRSILVGVTTAYITGQLPH